MWRLRCEYIQTCQVAGADVDAIQETSPVPGEGPSFSCALLVSRSVATFKVRIPIQISVLNPYHVLNPALNTWLRKSVVANTGFKMLALMWRSKQTELLMVQQDEGCVLLKERVTVGVLNCNIWMKRVRRLPMAQWSQRPERLPDTIPALLTEGIEQDTRRTGDINKAWN